MRVRLTDRVKAFLSSDEESFWFNHFTDEEKALRRMDVWEIASVINKSRANNLASDAEKLIVAEYMLNKRLTQIQAKASWGAGILGFSGAIIGVSLSIMLSQTISNEAQCAYEKTSPKQAITRPEKKALKEILKPTEHFPSAQRLNVLATEKPVKNDPEN